MRDAHQHNLLHRALLLFVPGHRLPARAIIVLWQVHDRAKIPQRLRLARELRRGARVGALGGAALGIGVWWGRRLRQRPRRDRRASLRRAGEVAAVRGVLLRGVRVRVELQAARVLRKHCLELAHPWLVAEHRVELCAELREFVALAQLGLEGAGRRGGSLQ